MMLNLPVPPSANNLHANSPHRRGRYKTGEYRDWIKVAGWCLIEGKPIHGPVRVSIVAPHNGRRDLDNHAKPCIDLLVSNGLIDSDRCKTVRHISMDWAAQDSEQSKHKLLTVEVLPA